MPKAIAFVDGKIFENPDGTPFIGELKVIKLELGALKAAYPKVNYKIYAIRRVK